MLPTLLKVDLEIEEIELHARGRDLVDASAKNDLDSGGWLLGGFPFFPQFI